MGLVNGWNWNGRNSHMTFSDLYLIGKKVLVGVIITLVPLLILAGTLWLSEALLHPR